MPLTGFDSDVALDGSDVPTGIDLIAGELSGACAGEVTSGKFGTGRDVADCVFFGA